MKTILFKIFSTHVNIYIYGKNFFEHDQHTLISRGHYLPGGQEEGACSLFYNPFILSRSLFTPRPCPAILIEVTIYPLRFTELFWLEWRSLFTLGPWAFAIILQTHKRQQCEIFTITKDKVGIKGQFTFLLFSVFPHTQRALLQGNQKGKFLFFSL